MCINGNDRFGLESNGLGLGLGLVSKGHVLGLGTPGLGHITVNTYQK